MSEPAKRYLYGAGGNDRIEITVSADKPFAASVRYARTLFKDHPALGFYPLRIVPPALERQACNAMADLCRQHGDEAEAAKWDARGQTVGIEDKLRRVFGSEIERDR